MLLLNILYCWIKVSKTDTQNNVMLAQITCELERHGPGICKMSGVFFIIPSVFPECSQILLQPNLSPQTSDEANFRIKMGQFDLSASPSFLPRGFRLSVKEGEQGLFLKWPGTSYLIQVFKVHLGGHRYKVRLLQK